MQDTMVSRQSEIIAYNNDWKLMMLMPLPMLLLLLLLLPRGPKKVGGAKHAR